ncbi:AraC family transcriptional regulator [uncultured Kordia sp.]|uniref:AraC family transcriptional regulator n=1 Tax=uncultured Kordia sp. TaxID=507699 RepID=UPI0026061CB5|nr:AraC family transcriptional regulator [uncultured Kordia sp.]
MLNFKQNHCSPFFKVFITLICIFSISNVFAQADSLATKSYDELTKLFGSTIYKDKKVAHIYIKAAHEKALASKDNLKISNTYYSLAFCNYSLANTSKALKLLEKSIEYSLPSKNTTSLFFNSYILKGLIKSDQGKAIEAIDAFIIAKENAIATKSPLKIINASNNIAYVKKMHNDYEDALTIYKENLKKIETIEVSEEVKEQYKIGILMNIPDTYLRMQEVDLGDFTKEASYYNKLALKISTKEKYTNYYYTFLLNEVIIEFEKENHAKSIAIAEEIIEYGLSVKDEAQLCTSYFYIGKNNYKVKNYEQAILYLEKAYDIISKSKRKYSNERLLHDMLAMSYTFIGNSKKTQFHLEKYKELRDEKSRTDIKVISNIHKRSDVVDLEDRIIEQNKRIKTEKTRKIWLYIISIILVVLLIISIIFYKIKVKRIQKNVENVLEKVKKLEKQQQKQKTVSTASISEKVTDSKAKLILKKLKKFEDAEEFLSQDCSLSFVAEKLDSNTSYISNVINNYKNQTFKSYITELRINAALIRLKNDHKLRSYTIKAIAEDFGFKRQETFSKAFKSQTGIYPSQYLKKLREGDQIN